MIKFTIMTGCVVGGLCTVGCCYCCGYVAFRWPYVVLKLRVTKGRD